MKNSLLTGFLFLGLCYAGTSFAQNESKNPELAVQLPAIPFPLTWHQLPQNYELSSTGIIIESGKETDLYSSVDGSKSTDNLPKLLFKPDSSFIFTAKVKPDFNKAYDGGAIIVYHDAETGRSFYLNKMWMEHLASGPPCRILKMEMIISMALFRKKKFT